MSNQDARDPYLGLNNHIRRQAQGQIPTYYTIGKVISLRPLVVRAAGMNLDKDDLKIAQHLTPSWKEALSELSWPLTADLPEKRFDGQCEIYIGTTKYTGTAWVTRPAETVNGKTTERATATHPNPLSVGDEVILIPSADGQRYYMVDKMVGVDV